MGNDELLEAESQPSNVQDVSAGDEREQSLYNPGNDKLEANIKKLKRRGPFKSKWAIIGGVGGGGIGIAVLILILIIFLSSLLVPGLAKNILTYEFTRVSRQLAEDDGKVLAESEAVQSVPAAEDGALSSQFSDLSDGLETSMKDLNINDLFTNLNNGSAIVFNYSDDGSLKSVTIDGQTVNIDKANPQDFKGTVDHDTANFSSDSQFGTEVGDVLPDALPDDGIGVLVRGGVEKQIEDEVGAPEYAWDVDDYDKDSQSQADQQQQVDAENAIDPDPSNEAASSIVDSESSAITNGANDEANDIKQVTTDGVPNNIPSLLTGETDGMSDAISGVIEDLNPVYKYLLPLCIIYDGSIQNTTGAQQTITLNSNEDQRSFFYLEAAADQQKSGNTDGQAVGALNNKLGSNIDESIPMEEADGQSPSTDTTISPQTAGDGEYTAVSAVAPSLAPFLNTVAIPACKAVTNIYVAGAGAAITIGVNIASIFTGGEGEAAEAALDSSEPAIDALAEDTVDQSTNTISALESAQAAESSASNVSVSPSKLSQLLGIGGKITKSAVTSVPVVAGISGLSLVVRLATAMKMGELNDGYSTGPDFANQATAGANLNANEDMQKQFYGVPLNSSQTAYNNVQDQQYIADAYSGESLYDRYISPSNPDSLVAKIGLSIQADLNKRYITSFIASITKIFNPTVLFSDIYNLLDPAAKVMADSATSDPNDSDFGIVQWGFTQQEEDLIQNNPSYQPLENDQILSNYQSIVQNYIEPMYGPCYDYNNDDSSSSDPTADSMSYLLTTAPTAPSGYSLPTGAGSYYIVRNASGDVTGGLCTEQFVGPNSSDSNLYDASDDLNDLAFRWRLQQAYENSAQTLTGIANANSSSQ